MAFIFCKHVGRVSQLLETTTYTSKDKDNNTTTSPSWASVITGLPAAVVQAELDLFNGQQADQDGMATSLTRVSISHVDHASVGVTGPPARLAELFDRSQILGTSRHAQLPITGGLCHVSNVYNDDDVQTVLRAARVWDQERWGSHPVRQPLLSPHTGAPFEAANAAGLIEAICAEALTKPLFFDKIAEGAVTQIQISQSALGSINEPRLYLGILHYRTSLISDNIVSTVAARLSSPSHNTVVQRQDLVDWVYVVDQETAADQNGGNPGMPQDSKLAVVGMACRMPGDADTLDKYWELLVQGRDTLSEVPADRFDLDAHFDPTMEGENTVGTRFGNFVSNPGFFDAGFFNMSPREVRFLD